MEPISAAALTEAERMQEQMHSYIKAAMEANQRLTYEDCVYTWLILKIAEVKTKIPAHA